MSIDVSQFHQVFFEESFEGLEVMEMGLLGLQEGAPDAETVNTIFRAAHSIKGGAGTFGFITVSDFTHHLETLLDELRNGRRKVSKEAVTVCLQAVDVLREMLNSVQDDADIDQGGVAEVTAQLEALLADQAGTIATEAAPVSEVQEATHTGWQITFIPNVDMLQTGNDPVRLFRELSELGDISISLDDHLVPAFVDLVPEECHLQWQITLRGDIDKAAITDIFEWVEDDCELRIEPISAATEIAGDGQSVDEDAMFPDPAALVENLKDSNEFPDQADVEVAPKPVEANQLKAKQATASDRTTSSIRVGTEKVDSLINLVGELVITQSMLTQLGENFVPEQLPKILDGLEQLERNTRELQEGIMRIRMMPISFAFNRFPRLVHDLSSKMGKKVELKLSGEQTELDKIVMEKIGDPLVHLVRNSLDHGLETPEKRIEVGKPETGVLHLNAYHQGGNIVIEIEDDGAGLNEEKILAKAIERGLVSETDELSSDRIHELIFMPGFSTADVISDVSGRGVGMDVVRKNIHSLGGTIEVKSEKGMGSKFTIHLPLTLAIMDGQIVQVSGQKYIVPLTSIIESVVIKPDTVKKVTGKGEVYKLRDEYIPIVRLYEVFNLEPGIERMEDGLLVIVEAENSKVGLLVDDLLSQQQIVIKSLETNYRNVTGLSGATILGDGMVALILDVTGLVTLYRNSPAHNDKHGIRAA